MFIKQEHKFLVRQRTVKDWVICSCVNCDMDTHAIHSGIGLDMLLATPKMQVLYVTSAQK